MSFEDIYYYLNYRFIIYNFDPGHQLGHALTVAKHAYLALKDFSYLTQQEKDAVILACILHDANDHKFISKEEDQVDLYKLLNNIVPVETISLTIKMIDLISCSQNGDSVISPSWLAIPRYADRLEAMGKIGLKRAISYATHQGRPFIDKCTLRAYTEEDLDSVATQNRYKEYTMGKRVSPTTMDHLYDKVLHLTVPDWLESPTLRAIAEKRRLWLRGYIIKYFKNDKVV